MKRILLFASFLGALGSALYSQNTTVTGDGQVIRDRAEAAGAVSAPPRAQGPNAQVTVTPGPQGLPIVNSSASAWPLGPALGEEVLNGWLNGIQQAGGTQADSLDSQDSPSAGSRPRTPNGRPVFEPPPMGGLPSFTAPRSTGRSSAAMGPDMVTSNPQVRPDLLPGQGQTPAGETRAPQGQDGQPVSQAPPQSVQFLAQAPSQEAAAGNGPPQPAGSVPRTPGQNPQPAAGSPQGNPASSSGKTVVIPSPVHYDRAGRRVIDPGWQETMYRMIQAERETQAAAQGMPPVQETQGSEETPGPGPLSQTEQAAGADQERVRETVILVPGPVTWRIRGTLTVAKGMLALEDAEGVLWYLPGLDRYIGYIDGLDAGEEAVLEGYAPPRGSSQERYFQPLRLFIDEMEYDLAVPPEGIYLGGSATVIREVERRDGAAGRNSGEARPGGRIGRTLPRQADNYGDGLDGDDRDEWEDIPAARGRQPGNRPPARPAWEHNHRSPWAPPSGVLDFKVDNDSFWRDDPARQERRERDSREIWY